MIKLALMITIVKRKMGEVAITFLSENKVPLTLGRYGRGTATDEMIDYLGIGGKEKYVLFSTLPVKMAENIIKKLRKKVDIESFSILVPISSVGGKKTMEYMSGESNDQNVEEKNFLYDDELIMVVTNRGYVDTVMDIARNAGAPGGTVIHARGTGTDSSEKFFGVTVGAEKEIILIVTEKEKKNDVMHAIMQKAGADSEAQSIIFSLPAKQYID